VPPAPEDEEAEGEDPGSTEPAPTDA
jgi:hypothetical protein